MNKQVQCHLIEMLYLTLWALTLIHLYILDNSRRKTALESEESFITLYAVYSTIDSVPKVIQQ